MTPEQVSELLQQALPDCTIHVQGGDGKFLITATGTAFEGLNAVKRQQLVYGIVNEHIVSGAIHAVSMHLRTPAESAAAQSD